MKKLLLIEDDKVVGAIYQALFQMNGFQVELAGDGRAGLSAVRVFKPDAVLLDLMLPGFNGIEILQRLRANPETQSLPVVVLTNMHLTQTLEKARAAGANECLVKAKAGPKQVVSAVQRVLDAEAKRLQTETSPAAIPASGGTAAAQDASAGVTRPNPPGMIDAQRTEPGSSRPTAGGGEGGRVQADQLVPAPSAADNIRSLLQELREQTPKFLQTEADAALTPMVSAWYRKVHNLASNAAVAEARPLASIASAVEAFLKELRDQPHQLNASTKRTLAQAIALLNDIWRQPLATTLPPIENINVLVVDDDPLSRRAVTQALAKAELKSTAVEDPQAAYKLLSEHRCALVVTDVAMPGMNGFELCEKLRALPAHRHTPVIFVTSLNHFDSRKSAALSGGDDFIGKPLMYLELAVKALCHVFRPTATAAAAKPFVPLTR